jgi:hypothetical protein
MKKRAKKRATTYDTCPVAVRKSSGAGISITTFSKVPQPLSVKKRTNGESLKRVPDGEPRIDFFPAIASPEPWNRVLTGETVRIFDQ